MGTVKWLMNADTAMEFFKRCHEQKAETEKERAKILAQLAVEGQMQSVSLTQKSKSEAVKEVAKAYGKVLHVDFSKKKGRKK